MINDQSCNYRYLQSEIMLNIPSVYNKLVRWICFQFTIRYQPCVAILVVHLEMKLLYEMTNVYKCV